jgi:hypothetical protein
MNPQALIHILCALGGALIHVLMKLWNLEKAGKMQTFTWKIWWKKNRFGTLLSVVTAIVVGAFFQTDMIEFYFGAGYAADSFLKNATWFGDKKKS